MNINISTRLPASIHKCEFIQVQDNATGVGETVLAGARYDWTESPGSHENSSGVLALIQYQPSEFSTLSAQVRRVRAPGGAEHDAAFFKWTFNIGPHGAHPY